MTAHGIHGREVAHQLWVLLSILAQEVQARPFVRHTLIHRDDGIEQYREIRTCVERGMGGDD